DSSCARLNETVNEPFSGMSIDREIRRRNILKAKAQKSLVEINTTVTNSVNEYFNTLKQDHLLDKSVHPKVEMKIVENIAIDGLPAYDLHTSFTYNIIGSSDRIDFELINYRSGKYLLDDSKAALATAMILKETITKYLHQYFEPGSIVKIKIVGTADSLPILSGIKLNHPYNMKNLESYWVTKKHSDTTESKSIATFNTENQLIFSNENLAFLRAFGIHHFIEHEIDHLRATRNEYQHEVLIEDGVGGSYRRVLVEVLVEDIFRNK
ncbi:MAG: hypothetical protein RJQ14_07615, partial [Marinoscillum sp.]